METLTDRIEAEAEALIETIDEAGGAARAVEQGLMQRAIADSAWAQQQAVESGAQVVVGVNRHVTDDAPPEIALPDFSALEAEQVARVVAARRSRDADAVAKALGAIAEAARRDGPLMPPIVTAVRARATLGEISDALREVWGSYSG